VKEAQRTAVTEEARREAEAQPAAPVAAALSAASSMEGHPAHAIVETRPEATAAAPQRGITAAEARSEAAVGT
jgi:hypothetical protein